jgi:hypothetical protein
MTQESRPEANANSSLLPGMAIIGVWMLLLALIGIIGVMMHHVPPFGLVLCAFFTVGAHGFIKLKRWGWAMTLGGVFLLMTYYTVLFARLHQGPALAMAIPNLVFFLYLVRPEVRERLR